MILSNILSLLILKYNFFIYNQEVSNEWLYCQKSKKEFPIEQPKRIYPTNHKPLIDVVFKQNQYDFIVDEIVQSNFDNKNKYLIMQIKKTFLTTWDLINHIQQALHCKENDIGYAGLKDKFATTTQYISIPIRFSKDIHKKIENKNVQILKTFKHSQRISIGDLLGNKFTINLFNVDQKKLEILYAQFSKIQKHGMPNYFGYQRFGSETDFEYLKNVVYGEEHVKDTKTFNMFISMYQSYFFNGWLSKRVSDSAKNGETKLQLHNGEIMYDFSSHKTFTAKNVKQKSIQEQYLQKKIVPTGLLPGRKVYRAIDEARKIEELFDDPYIHEKGYRRAAWIYPKNMNNTYDSEENKLTVSFELPKGSYATVLIENLLNKNLSA